MLQAKLGGLLNFTRPPTHPPTRPPAHARTHPPTHAPTHPRTHARTHSPTHPLTHSLARSLAHSLDRMFTILPHISAHHWHSLICSHSCCFCRAPTFHNRESFTCGVIRLSKMGQMLPTRSCFVDRRQVLQVASSSGFVTFTTILSQRLASREPLALSLRRTIERRTEGRNHRILFLNNYHCRSANSPRSSVSVEVFNLHWKGRLR